VLFVTSVIATKTPINSND